MAVVDAQDILGQIQLLVVDKLQVVSYKWLSRNFSVSSDHAKRLLQEYVDKHGDEVEVIYSLSGWLSNNSQTFCIKLASSEKLEEAKKKFDSHCTVHVYSIQACIPQDLAVIWNAEFVQAEELFDQPPTAENCLWNNRFGAISNPFVNRVVGGKSAVVSIDQPKIESGIALKTKTEDVMKDVCLQQPFKGGNLGTKEDLKSSNAGFIEKTAQNVDDGNKKPLPVKESTNPLQDHKKGVLKDKDSSESGGSLASLWGRASLKHKHSSMVKDANSNIPCDGCHLDTADAQIFAQEAAEVASSDDDEFARIPSKRDSNVSGTRKRQFIMHFSDEDDDEDNVVSLASPEPANANSRLHSSQNTKKVNKEKEQKTDSLVSKKDMEKSFEISEKSSNASMPKEENNIRNDLNKTSEKDSSPVSSKRKKVVKTRIDERGREVMEVVWEESGLSKGDANDSPTTAAEKRHVVTANKDHVTGSYAPVNTGSKAAAKKPGRVGGKDSKQGNILSFFKKI
ncbi:hypothetical protein HPP92_023719 [Vanilla planifolia]|uniref:DNA polymerase delta subunit 3 n=1 Tax=Vanilla planifolia TaxID=51239 RepID=A0A835PL38_VANPL|nr:hypothetical protein HPP92_023719 [Vanilla planifolia]